MEQPPPPVDYENTLQILTICHLFIMLFLVLEEVKYF